MEQDLSQIISFRMRAPSRKNIRILWDGQEIVLTAPCVFQAISPVVLQYALAREGKEFAPAQTSFVLDEDLSLVQRISLRDTISLRERIELFFKLLLSCHQMFLEMTLEEKCAAALQ